VLTPRCRWCNSAIQFTLTWKYCTSSPAPLSYILRFEQRCFVELCCHRYAVDIILLVLHEYRGGPKNCVDEVCLCYASAQRGLVSDDSAASSAAFLSTRTEVRDGAFRVTRVPRPCPHGYFRQHCTKRVPPKRSEVNVATMPRLAHLSRATEALLVL
jgi:hypothetical protein